MDAQPGDGEPAEPSDGGRSLDGESLDRPPVSLRGTLGAREPSSPRRLPAAARRWTLWTASASMACIGALVVYQVLLSGLASGSGLPDAAPPGTTSPVLTTVPGAGGVPAAATSTRSTPRGVPSGTGARVTPPVVVPTETDRPTVAPSDPDDVSDGHGRHGDDDGDNSGHGSGHSGSGSDSGSEDSGSGSGSGEDNSGPGSDG